MDDAGDFHVFPVAEDYGKITMTWEESQAGIEGTTETFDLGSTGFFTLFEKQDPDLLLPDN